MGIKGLLPFLKKKFSGVFENVSFAEFSGKSIAVDTSLYMYKFKAKYGDRWQHSLKHFIETFQRYHIKLVFVYEGQSPPEKRIEKLKRREKRNKIENRIRELENAIALYHQGKIVTLPITTPLHEDINFYIQKLEKLKSQIVSVRSTDFDEARFICNQMNIVYYNAEMEAETKCIELHRKGIVDAVLSEDSDVLAYGCGIALLHANMSGHTFSMIKFSKLLDSLQLTSNEFIDFCILCGTDYNRSIAPYTPEVAYFYILNKGKLQNIQNEYYASKQFQTIQNLFNL